MANDWLAEPILRTRLATLLGSPPKAHAPLVGEWMGTAYRFASRLFADTETFTDGEGARRFGGRFTPVGGPRTLYLSLDPVTATAELVSWYEYYGVPETAFQPRLLAAVGVCVGLLLDLTTPETQSAIGVHPTHLAEEWRPAADAGEVAPVQAFGRLACEAGFEGLYFPSARREGGVNLALFPDNFRHGSHAMMLNAEVM
jgi:RES domain-containing protein